MAPPDVRPDARPDARTIVITGGSSGIGAAAARALRQVGAHVIITGRSAETARLAAEIGAEHHLVDYTRLDDVRRFAATLLARHPRLDALVNNVGGVIAERRLTPDGHEQTFQVNHLAGFLLTHLLHERLAASEGRVINTASGAHWLARLAFDDLESARGYQAMRAYGTAKLMNVLHARELGRRYPGVHAASFHPGVVRTGFGREGGRLVRWFYESPLGSRFMLSPERGADTLRWLLDGTPGRDWPPGGYFERRRPGRASPQVNDALAARLWDASARLVGVA